MKKLIRAWTGPSGRRYWTDQFETPDHFAVPAIRQYNIAECARLNPNFLYRQLAGNGGAVLGTKSNLLRQFARSNGLNCVDIKLTHFDQSDILGLPLQRTELTK